MGIGPQESTWEKLKKARELATKGPTAYAQAEAERKRKQAEEQRKKEEAEKTETYLDPKTKTWQKRKPIEPAKKGFIQSMIDKYWYGKKE